MSDDQQNTAEAIDPDELGDDPAGDLGFPPDTPIGVDDPTQDGHIIDSVAGRDAREQPESYVVPTPGRRLYAPNALLTDDVAELTADSISADDLSSEEAAVHLVDQP